MRTGYSVCPPLQIHPSRFHSKAKVVPRSAATLIRAAETPLQTVATTNAIQPSEARPGLPNIPLLKLYPTMESAISGGDGDGGGGGGDGDGGGGTALRTNGRTSDPGTDPG